MSRVTILGAMILSTLQAFEYPGTALAVSGCPDPTVNYPAPYVTTYAAQGPGPVVTFPGPDGIPMIAIGSWVPPENTARGITIFRSTGGGGWIEIQAIDVGRRVDDIALGEVTGDDRLDLIVATEEQSNNVIVLRQDTPGHFAFHAATTVNRAHGFGVGDIDGNGINDLLVAGFFAANKGFLNLASSGFSAPLPDSLGILANHVAIGDTDGDLRNDAVFVSQNGNLTVFHGTGVPSHPLSFSPTTYSAPGSTYARFVDLDADARTDLVVAGYESNVIYVLWMTPAGLDAPISIPVELKPNWFEVAEVNGDAQPDLVVPNREDNSVWFLEQSPGSPRSFCLASSASVPDGPVNIVAGQFDLTSPHTDFVVTRGNTDSFSTLTSPVASSAPASELLDDPGDSHVQARWLLNRGDGTSGAIALDLRRSSPVTVFVYDLEGRLLGRRSYGVLDAGPHRLTLELGVRGVAFLRLLVGEDMWSGKAIQMW